MKDDLSATPGQKPFPVAVRKKGEKIDLTTIVQIVALIQQGDFPDIAALRLGISKRRWDAMMSSNRAKYRRFQHMVDTASAMAQSVVTANLYKAAQEEPKIALEWLARTDPQRWAPVKAREVKINDQAEKDAAEVKKEGPDVGKLLAASIKLFAAAADRARANGVLPSDSGAEPVHTERGGEEGSSQSLPQAD